LPGSSLTQKLEGIKKSNPTFEFQIFDKEKIEQILLSTGPGQGIAQRYFPDSYNKWSKQNFDIDLAMARIGMPQPVAYKMPNEDKVLTLEEVGKLYPQGNQYMWNPWLPGNLILCNNILGITKIVERGGELVDPPADYFERMNESISHNIEHMRQQALHNAEFGDSQEVLKKPKVGGQRKPARQRMAKESRKRNRKNKH
jgi:hypothetical protein